jgi:hypothetical protein
LNAKLSKFIHFLIRFNELCRLYGQQGEAKSDVTSPVAAVREELSSLSGQTVEPATV